MWNFSTLLLNVFQWSNNGDCALSPHWTAVPHCSCRNFGSSHRLRRENHYIDKSRSAWNRFVLCVVELTFPSCLKETSKSQPSSLWWPEHCKDESKMHLHRQQADVYHILKGLVLFVLMFSEIFIGFLVCHKPWPWMCLIHLGIYSTGELPSGTVLALTVDDPRLTLPRKRVKALPLVQQAQGKIGPRSQTLEGSKFANTEGA